ncbi:ABZJ_00895 family protein [uncultured Methylophaga sp.]|uniref:ABZJ_00895 family protein n=1 Tax=uncultured Methylophaga sp. TaxID=285271 RepID=UPI0026071CCF|nr:ABZJ_00895 family protein [uncultured Methylophaga sp.]
MTQDVKLSKYILRFGLVNLALLIVLSIVSALLEIESGSGVTIGALMGAAIFAVAKFIQDNKRVPTSSEKTKLVWFSYLTSWLVSLLIVSIFVTLTSEHYQVINFMKSNPLILIGILAFLTVFYVGVLYLSYGYLARKQFESMKKRGKI